MRSSVHESSFLVVGCITILLNIQCLFAASINCGEVGTFTNAKPFDSLPLPRCPIDPALNVQLVLYTRLDPTVGQAITRTSVPTTFKNNQQTWFIVPGWQSTSSMPEIGGDPWIAWITDAALKKGDYNIIVVEWNSLDPNYFQPAADVRTVGAQMALIAQKNLVAQGLPQRYLYCIGASLGAHVCAFASKTFKFGRITGLDPAGPAFDPYFLTLSDTEIGLNSTDAYEVDVVHTNPGQAGTTLRRGQIDFWATGISTLVPGYAHVFAVLLYNSSVGQPIQCFIANSNTLTGHCSMGFYADKCTLRGDFTVRVTTLPPYCSI